MINKKIKSYPNGYIFKKYLIFYAVILFLCAIPLLCNYFYLNNNGELLDLNTVVKRQHESTDDTLYGTALHNDIYHYKLELYKHIKPEILALGSSRVMQFKKACFNRSFANTGGAMSSLDRGEQFIKQILPLHKPNIILLGIDFWWFNENYQPIITSKSPPKENERLTFNKLFKPTKWLYDGKITIEDYCREINPFHAYKKQVGVKANLTNSGFLPDGSHRFSGERIKKSKSANTKVTKYATTGRFVPCNSIAEKHITRLINFVDYLKSEGIEVIIFIPPVSHSYCNYMNENKEQYKYLDILKENLKKRGVFFYDYHNPKSINSTRTEFVDGIHGGDITYVRILNAMAEDKNNSLNQYVDQGYIDHILKSYKDLPCIPQEKNLEFRN